MGAEQLGVNSKAEKATPQDGYDPIPSHVCTVLQRKQWFCYGVGVHNNIDCSSRPGLLHTWWWWLLQTRSPSATRSWWLLLSGSLWEQSHLRYNQAWPDKGTDQSSLHPDHAKPAGEEL